MGTQFVAIDVETANADMSSICQIGLARYAEGHLADTWCSLVDPQDDFAGQNISVHGIDDSAVRGAPVFPAIYEDLTHWLAGEIVVCHTHFDRVSLQQSSHRHQLDAIDCTWLDSAKVARRTWTQFAKRGYGLGNICDTLGYQFQHHDALEDAKACGHILLRALEQSELSLNDWLVRANTPIAGRDARGAKGLEGNGDGALQGETIVFTGALATPRREAAAIAAAVGCDVANSVTKKTTLLVVGDQDLRRLDGRAKSSKHLKAEQLIAQGRDIRILQESDFHELVRVARQDAVGEGNGTP